MSKQDPDSMLRSGAANKQALEDSWAASPTDNPERRTKQLFVEDYLIGKILVNPSVLAKCSIAAMDFTDIGNRAIFRAILALVSEGLEVDTFSVTERVYGLGAGPGFERVGSLFKNSTESESTAIAYANALRGYSTLDRIQELLAVAHEEAAQTTDPERGERLRGRLITRLVEMGEPGQRKSALSMADVLGRTVDHIESVLKSKAEGRTVGVPTGIPALDDDTGGCHKGELTVVGARPGTGKSALGLCIALNAARLGYRIGFVSIEMPEVQLGARLLALDSGVPQKKIRDATLEEHEYSALMSAAVRVRELPIQILDKPACKLSDIHIQARAWSLLGGLDLLVVDYLQRMQPDERSESRTREVGKFSSGLATLARALNIPVIALAQLNRLLASRSDKRPILSDLRDSGEIEQDADSVWMLHRPSEYDREASDYEAEIIIEKNRHGPKGIVRCGWVGDVMRWEGRQDYRNQ